MRLKSYIFVNITERFTEMQPSNLKGMWGNFACKSSFGHHICRERGAGLNARSQKTFIPLISAVAEEKSEAFAIRGRFIKTDCKDEADGSKHGID